VALPGAIAFVIGVIAAALTAGIAALGVLTFREIRKMFIGWGWFLGEVVIPGVKTFFTKTLPNAANQFFSAFPGTLKTLVFQELPKLPGWIKDAAIPGVKTFFTKTLPSEIWGAVQFVILALKLIGGILWGALLGGLKAGLGLFAPVRDFFQGLWNKFKAGYNWFLDKLGIGSPSKLFMQIGAAIPQGLIEGIQGGVSQLEHAMHGLLPREFSVGAAGPIVPTLPSGGGGGVGRGGGVIINNYITGTWDLSNPNHIEQLTSALTGQIRRNLAMGA